MGQGKAFRQLLQRRVHVVPFLGTRSPDVCRRAIATRIIQTRQMDSHSVGAARIEDEQARSAFGAESPAHRVTALCLYRVVRRLTGYPDRSGRDRDGGNEGRTARLLTISTMTIQSHQRLRRRDKANSSAGASSRKRLCHASFPPQVTSPRPSYIKYVI